MNYFEWQERKQSANRSRALQPTDLVEFPEMIVTEHRMPTIPWLQVIDEALVVSHLNVANATDSYDVARQKLHELICLEIEIATDPRVNGGFSLQKEIS